MPAGTMMFNAVQHQPSSTICPLPSSSQFMSSCLSLVRSCSFYLFPARNQIEEHLGRRRREMPLSSSLVLHTGHPLLSSTNQPTNKRTNLNLCRSLSFHLLSNQRTGTKFGRPPANCMTSHDVCVFVTNTQPQSLLWSRTNLCVEIHISRCLHSTFNSMMIVLALVVWVRP